MKRHFSGKPLAEEHSDSSSDEDEAEETQVQPSKKVIIGSENQGANKEAMVPKPSIAVPVVKGGEEEQKEEYDDEEDEDDEVDDNDQSDDDSDEDDSDEDDSDEDDSSSDEEQILKPVFLSKKQRESLQKKPEQSSTQEKASISKERTLKAIETHIQQEMDYRKELTLATQNYGGIDDTDDLDPENERAEWELRQLQREKRERERLEKEMEELEDLEERRLRTEEERDEEAQQILEAEQKERDNEESEQQKIKGAFYQDESLLKRTMKGDVEKYDRKTLLPQRYKPEGSQ